ncbi:MAG: zinc-ribbon domain-containing protein [Myxococcaceae bacterium]|nr:zinc-ribbon domain-containing protein [Myxococcaceae bacterium]
MIVKCEQCQTKFKIPDDKVTDKGVKVRCTKCNHTFRVTKESAGGAAPAGGVTVAAPTTKLPVPKAVALDSADPFSRFGQTATVSKDEETRPGVFVLGLEASRNPDLGRTAPHPAPPPLPGPPAAPTPASSASFDFSSLTPPSSAAAAPAPSNAATAPFDFAALMGPPPAGSPAAPARPPGPAPFDFSAMTAPPPPAPVAAPPPPPRTSAPPRPMDAPPMSFDFSSLGAPPASAGAPVAAPAPVLPDLLDLPPPPAGGAMPPTLGDDFFAAPTQSHTGPLPSVPEGASKEDARNALFEMGAAGAAVEPVPVAPAPQPPAAATEAPPFSSSPSGAAPVPKPPDPATERGRRALGIVVNVLIAAVLVVGLVVVGTATFNEGKLDLQSLTSSLKALVTPASVFPADDISNGLYDTKMGRPVFFVRGVVKNRSGAAARVRVRAEILDGASLVRSAEVLAGAPPSPEELFRLGDAAELKLLMERTSTKAAAIEADAEAPFLVTFAEYPPDLKAFRVRVTASAEGQAAAAATP